MTSVTVPALDLHAALRDARARTLALVADLSNEQLRVPYSANVNPFLWELGHIAWFQEKWVLRHLRGEQPILPDADALYDSARVPHETRWNLALPSRAATLEYLQAVLDRVLRRVAEERSGKDEFHFPYLVLM